VPGTVIGALIGLALAPVLLSAIFGLYLLLIATREVRRLRCARDSAATVKSVESRTALTV